MRYVRVRAMPATGQSFHPLGEAVASEPTVKRGKLHRVEIMDDDRGIMLAELRGDLDSYLRIVEASEYVYDYRVVESDGWWYAYVVFEPNDVIHQLLRTRYETELMIQMPIEVESDGSMLGTLVGPEEAFREFPVTDSEEYSLEITEAGEYHPDLDDLYLSLTRRQREILDIAVERGYYDDPRQVTHADIASDVGTSASTVGEHLRKVESRVFQQLAR